MISITNAAKEPHITPLQDSMWHRGMAGIDSCVFNFFENFAAEVSSNNSVKIRSGIGMIQGRYFCVEPSTYDEVTIANGTQGEKRKDLIVCRWTVDEEQKVQSGDWVVIQGTPTTGTPAAPSYTDGDLDAGDLIADMPFYEVILDGINVTGVAQKFTSLGGIGKFPNPLPISKGGTGATTPADALALFGVYDHVIEEGETSDGTNGYIKFANGLMFQWGSKGVQTGQGASTMKVDFPAAFKDTKYRFLALGNYNFSEGITVSENIYTTGAQNRTTTSTTVSIYKTGNPYWFAIDWFAIGKWK